MKFRTILLLATLGITLLLSGCMIPENFEANVTVHKDGSYTFTYDGTLVFALALESEKKAPLSDKDEADLKKEAEKLQNDPDFKKAEYIGKGRYKVLVETTGQAGKPYYFLSKQMDLISIIPKQDGSIEITTTQIGKKELKDLNAFGIKIDGTFSVSLEDGVKVIKHNAQSEPSMFGLFGDYEWEIKTVEAEQPLIIVQPSP